MKTTNAIFLAKQAKAQIEDEFYVYLFEQWDYAITDRDDATHIKIQGDATSWISNGDVFIIPLDDFDTYHTITASPSYDAPTNKTTITCSGSSFGTGVVGLYIALKYDITNDVLKDGISDIRISTEGETLNTSLADDVQIAVDNVAESYWDSDGASGLFNTGRIFWVQIIFKLVDDATTFLYFGGLVYLPSVQPVCNLQNVEFTCSGHLKELERYPGFRITEENGILPMNPGIETVSVVEPSAGIIECIRDLKFNFPDGIDIKNLTFVSVSLYTNPTPAGWHVIKYQPPNLWQYDFGSWTTKTAGNTGETLTSAKGHTIVIDMPATFDVEAREDWFFLSNRIDAQPEQIGKFSLQFSNGKKINLRPTFERVLFYDSSGGTYTDISLYANTFDSDQQEIVGSANDEIYLMSKEPFYGVKFELDTDLVGTIVWYYSTGYNTYSTLTKTDGTSNLSQDGAVTWNAPADWRNVDNLINSVQYENYYFIKIKCTVYTSGSCDLKRLFKYIRLIGDDGAELTVKCRFEHFAAEARQDNIILREDSSDVIQAHCWMENISVYQYLQAIMTEASYSTANQSLGNMHITSASEIISLMGRPPKNFYHKKPTAVLVDPNYPLQWGGIRVYLGIEDELWIFDYENGYQFLDKLKPYIRAADDAFFKLEIRRLEIDGNGYLQGMAWKDYFDQPKYGMDYSVDIDIGRRTPAVVFRSTDLTTITEQNWIDSGGNSIFTSQEVSFRDGVEDTGVRYIGQWGNDPGPAAFKGENLCLPIPQRVFALESPIPEYENRNSLSHRANIGQIANISTKNLAPGHYAVIRDPTEVMGLCFTLGQKGFVNWDEGNDRWIFVKWTGAAWKMSAVEYDLTITDLVELTDYTNQIPAGCFYNAKIYYALMSWDESGGTFPGDYSDCFLKRCDDDGANDTTLFDFSTDSVEANQSLTIGDEIYCTILDMVYNINETTIHGVLLNRADFEYHYFVYDITNDKMYTTQTGTGFTFNSGRQIKELVYNASDHNCYAVIVDLRNKQETAFLVNASFAVPGGAPDGSEITLTYKADIIQNEWDVQVLVYADGIIYGLTKPGYNYLFQYDEVIYPVIFLDDTGEDNCRECLDNLAQLLNMIVSIGPERKFYLKGRESNKGSTTIYEANDYIKDSMQPLRVWPHKYDGVEVAWQNPFTGESGVKQAGIFGWQRRILKISNPFIQYPQLAKVIADIYYAFFDDYRMMIEFGVYPLWQLDNRDKFQFSYSVNRFDFDTSTWWMIEELIYNFFNAEMTVKALEME